MKIFENIYGTLFTGAIAAAFFYLTYGFWSDNPTFSIILGFFGLVFAFYSIGLFFLPLIDNIKSNHMETTYPTKQELNKKRWYKTRVTIKWIIVRSALLAPIMADNGVWYIDGIINAVLWYLILSLVWYVTKLIIYGKPPKDIKLNTVEKK